MEASTCFICLEETHRKSDDYAKIQELKLLWRLLNHGFHDDWPTRPGSYCGRCSKLVENVRALYKEQEGIRLRLEVILDKIRRLLERPSKTLGLNPGLFLLRQKMEARCKRGTEVPKVAVRRLRQTSTTSPATAFASDPLTQDEDGGDEVASPQVEEEDFLEFPVKVENDWGTWNTTFNEEEMEVDDVFGGCDNEEEWAPEEKEGKKRGGGGRRKKYKKRKKPVKIEVKQTDGLWKCDYCSATYGQKGGLKRHLMAGHPFVPFLNLKPEATTVEQFGREVDAVMKKLSDGRRCKLCAEKFPETRDAVMHIVSDHRKEVVRKLGGGEEEVASSSEEEAREKKVESTTAAKAPPEMLWMCRYCPLKYSHPSHLKRHVATVHTFALFLHLKPDSATEPEFIQILEEAISHLRGNTKHCSICDKNYTEMREVVLHLVTRHRRHVVAKLKEILGHPLSEVEVPTSNFVRFRSLGNNLFECGLCGKRLTRSGKGGHAKRHKISSGEAEKAVACKLCEKRFLTLYGCRQHIASCHKAALFAPCKPEAQSEEEFTKTLKTLVRKLALKSGGRESRYFMCTLCGGAVTRKGREAIVLHLRKVHLAEVNQQVGGKMEVGGDEGGGVDDFWEWRGSEVEEKEEEMVDFNLWT